MNEKKDSVFVDPVESALEEGLNLMGSSREELELLLNNEAFGTKDQKENAKKNLEALMRRSIRLYYQDPETRRLMFLELFEQMTGCKIA